MSKKKEIPLTFEDLANLYDRTTGGKARTMPLEVVTAWARTSGQVRYDEKQDLFFAASTEDQTSPEALTEFTEGLSAIVEALPTPTSSFLPQKKREPRADLTKAKILIYGPPKIGKSTLASNFPGVWFLATEEGLAWLPVYEPTQITSWEQFLEVCAYIEESRPTAFGDGTPIHTIVIDTVDLLFKMAFDYMCTHLGVASLADLDWGKGWQALSDEFARVICKITRWPYGLVFISHSKEKEIKSGGRKIDRIEPAVMTTGYKIVNALVDLILYCCVNEVAVVDSEGEFTGEVKESRSIRCAPASNIVAGDRSGMLPNEIPLNYTELVKYFPATPNYKEAIKDAKQNQNQE